MREIVIKMNDGTSVYRSITVQPVRIENMSVKRYSVCITEYNTKYGNELICMHHKGLHDSEESAIEIMEWWQDYLEIANLEDGQVWKCTSNRTIYGSVGHNELELMDEEELRHFNNRR